MPTERRQFNPLGAGYLHWTMAAVILSMFCIGLTMVASLAYYHTLVSLHRPLGVAILILAVVRFVNRKLSSIATIFVHDVAGGASCRELASEYVLYGLMVAMPLVGWGMLSAALIQLSCSAPCICRSSFRTMPCCTLCCGRRTLSSRVFLS